MLNLIFLNEFNFSPSTGSQSNANPDPHNMAESVTMPVASFPIAYPFTGGWFSPSFRYSAYKYFSSVYIFNVYKYMLC